MPAPDQTNPHSPSNETAAIRTWHGTNSAVPAYSERGGRERPHSIITFLCYAECRLAAASHLFSYQVSTRDVRHYFATLIFKAGYRREPHRTCEADYRLQVTGLQPDTLYDIEVKAWNSSWSAVDCIAHTCEYYIGMNQKVSNS